MDGVLAYPTYKPAMRGIISITNTDPAIIVTGEITYPAGVVTITPLVHGYIDGIIMRIMVPWFYGMQQMDGQWGEIVVINTTTFAVDIDSTMFDSFVIPPCVLVPDPHPGDPLHMTSLPPVRQLTDGTWALEQFAQSVPFAEDNDLLLAAVANVLPY